MLILFELSYIFYCQVYIVFSNIAGNENGYEMLVDLRSDFLSARYALGKGDKPD